MAMRSPPAYTAFWTCSRQAYSSWKKVVVVGGGDVGLRSRHALDYQGKENVLLEMMYDILTSSVL
jgi:NADPH-dependent 2,4-dienoyl-CoA reductase/sulfur reductase-like enzyme